VHVLLHAVRVGLALAACSLCSFDAAKRICHMHLQCTIIIIVDYVYIQSCVHVMMIKGVIGG
jgi:hypothetical protein